MCAPCRRDEAARGRAGARPRAAGADAAPPEAPAPGARRRPRGAVARLRSLRRGAGARARTGAWPAAPPRPAASASGPGWRRGAGRRVLTHAARRAAPWPPPTPRMTDDAAREASAPAPRPTSPRRPTPAPADAGRRAAARRGHGRGRPRRTVDLGHRLGHRRARPPSRCRDTSSDAAAATPTTAADDDRATTAPADDTTTDDRARPAARSSSPRTPASSTTRCSARPRRGRPAAKALDGDRETDWGSRRATPPQTGVGYVVDARQGAGHQGAASCARARRASRSRSTRPTRRSRRPTITDTRWAHIARPLGRRGRDAARSSWASGDERVPPRAAVVHRAAGGRRRASA